MQKFKVGDGVTVTEGPMKGLYATVVWFYDKKEQYLVRFSGTQQVYFTEDQIVPWSDR
ncbi:hypothetical protein [Demetria terragena]|uniref:hypothetical protein n=1 Tax=Demetria terragena TaxID=63959 RepID=UPI000382ABBC|nr:hypothetical protein [Demetria terragena]